MPNQTFEDWAREAVRELERYKDSHEPQMQERWGNQFRLNKKLEANMVSLEDCMHKLSTNLKMNNFKLTAIFVVVQIVIGAIATAVVVHLFGH